MTCDRGLINLWTFQTTKIETKKMSAVQSACIAHRNGDGNLFDEGVVLEQVVDANGDLLMKASSSSEEDVASCSSKDEESDEIIGLKTK